MTGHGGGAERVGGGTAERDGGGTAERVAAIDCGTNSIRLLIADRADGRLTDLTRQLRIVRLGQDVDRTGRLAPEAIERTRQALADYADAINAAGATVVRMAATSATRDAANRDEFAAMVRGALGVEPEVISGAEEARLSFVGAVSGLPDAPSKLLVADIGGGSTELVAGSPGDRASLRAHSMNIGCVRMTERHLADDPPTAAQVAGAVADIDAAIERAARDVPLAQAGCFVGVAGTVTQLAAVALGLTSYDPAVIHGATLSAAQVREWTARLLRLDHAGRVELPAMHPGRADVITAGALILDRLVGAVGAAEVVVSEHDILDGLAIEAR